MKSNDNLPPGCSQSEIDKRFCDDPLGGIDPDDLKFDKIYEIQQQINEDKKHDKDR